MTIQCDHANLERCEDADGKLSNNYYCDFCEGVFGVQITNDRPPPKLASATITGFIEVEHEVTVTFEYPKNEHVDDHARKALLDKAQQLGGTTQAGNVTGSVLWDNGWGVGDNGWGVGS